MFPKPERKPKQRTRRKDQNKLYGELVKPAYLRGLAAGQKRGVALCECCLERRATQIHHKRGRVGADLLDTRYFMGVCDACHSLIHSSPTWAYAQGYLVRRDSLSERLKELYGVGGEAAGADADGADGYAHEGE